MKLFLVLWAGILRDHSPKQQCRCCTRVQSLHSKHSSKATPSTFAFPSILLYTFLYPRAWSHYPEFYSIKIHPSIVHSSHYFTKSQTLFWEMRTNRRVILRLLYHSTLSSRIFWPATSLWILMFNYIKLSVNFDLPKYVQVMLQPYSTPLLGFGNF